MAQATLTRVPSPPGLAQRDGVLVRIATAFTAWAERWFPDAFVFVAIAVVVVALAAIVNGASPMAVSEAFGDGFWSLITFTMQMAFVAIGGYVVATSGPAQRLRGRLAAMPATGSGAVGLVATVSIDFHPGRSSVPAPCSIPVLHCWRLSLEKVAAPCGYRSWRKEKVLSAILSSRGRSTR